VWKNKIYQKAIILPFGLTNAPTTFMSFMNSYYLGKFVLVFLYDMLIYSKFKEEHMEHLKAIFEILKTNKLFVKKSKCNFGVIQIYYLGHVVQQILERSKLWLNGQYLRKK
jgi:hypothetical protein